MTNHNLAVALRLGAAGMAIFPTDPRKRPLIKNWDEGSSSDLGQIRRWWRVRQGALAAIDLRKAGLVVIDADRHGGPDGVNAWLALALEHGADLAVCPHVRTPNNGLHIYFTQPHGEPLRCRSGDLPPAVECKGAGGSITAPGNIKADGTFYESVPGRPELVEAYAAAGRIPPVPDWLAAIIRAPKAAREPVQSANSPAVGSGASRLERYARAALAGQAADVAASGEGARNIRLNAAAYRLGRFAARGWLRRDDVEAALKSAAQECGLTADDGLAAVDATIASGFTAGLANPANDPRSRT